MKLKYVIYNILIIFTILPLIGFGLFMIYANNKNISEIVAENLAVSSSAQVLNIENFCKTRKEYLENIGQFALVHDAIQSSLEQTDSLSYQEKSYLYDTLYIRVVSNEFSESLTIIDKNFNIVASSSPYQEGKISILKQASDEFLTGDFIMSDTINSERGEEQVIAAFIGIYDQNELIGYLVEEINLNFFDKIRKESKLGDYETLYLLDGNRKLITAGDGSEESRKEFVLSQEERRKLGVFNDIDLSAGSSGQVEYMVNGEQYITSYSRINHTNWCIMLSSNLTRFQERRFSFMVLIGITLLAVICLLMTLHYYISKKLTKPVEYIIDTLRNIQDNQDYSLRVNNSRKDETGVLSAEIDLLLEYIEKENQKEKQHQYYLKEIAEHDSLTGLYNRKGIQELIAAMLVRCVDKKTPSALAVIDVDNFKEFNTKYGHLGGDTVLKHIATLLKEIKGAIAGRIGGDEFLIAIENGTDLDHCLSELSKKLNEGLVMNEGESYIPTPCSIGAVLKEGNCTDYETLFLKADEALYRAKENGKNTYYIIRHQDYD